MNAQEKDFRIGNYVSHYTQIIELDGVTTGYLTAANCEVIPPDQVEGIPLSEEWLKKFGFALIDQSPFTEIKLKYWVKNRVCLFFNDPILPETKPSIFLLGFADQRMGVYSVVTLRWIDKVHELQNAYSLTGEELSISEPIKKVTE